MKYTAIYDVSRALLELIREKTIPDIIAKPEDIGLCSPANHGDYAVGLYLYSIELSDSLRLSGKQNEGLFLQKHPPVVLDLYYMLTPYFKTDVKFLAEQEQLLFGKVIQAINDNSRVFTDTNEPVELQSVFPDVEEKQRIWNSDSSYRTSIFIEAKAVIIESLMSEKVARVTDVTIAARQKRS